MFLRTSKFPFWYIFIYGLLHLAEGIIMTLSFGFLTPNGWTLKYVIWYHKRKYLKSKKS